MNVLVIGSGGREHAIVWKLKQSPKAGKLYAAPGNAGIAELAECIEIKADDINALINFVKQNDIGLTVVGPEIPLEQGIVNEFKKAGLTIFGPTREAARLETSKIFAKDFMLRYNIPTAKYRTFNIDTKPQAAQYLNSISYPVVIKADGLAAGKGVIICENKEDAFKTVNEFFEDRVFGEAGENMVIEEFLIGNEASVFAICDGSDYVILPAAQDHKKIGEGETGKNTGGMGSFAPALNIVTEDVLDNVRERIIEPVLAGMKIEGNLFCGCLFCGLMVDNNNDPHVIEFNVRFGDPENQVVLPLIKSDLVDLLYASVAGKLAGYELSTFDGFYTCVVLASDGYPDKYETGKEITGLDKVNSDCLIFHSGTKKVDGKIVSTGGRVLNVVGFAETELADSIESAYINVDKINFENKYFRRDIGLKGLGK